MKESLIALKVPGLGPSDAPVEIQGPTGIPTNLSVTNLASGFLAVIMTVGIIVALFYMIYGGFFWIQSRGDKQKLDKARRIILYSLLGIIIMSLSLIVVNVISSAFGVKSATQ